MKSIDAGKNAFDATKILLNSHKVPVTRHGLQEALWQHPDFPSLSAMSDVLNDLKVPNLPTRLTPERLHEIPLPALTYLNIDGGMFAPIRSVNGSVEWLHTERGWQKESLRQFAQKWSGITLLIEPNDRSGERDFEKNVRRQTLETIRIAFIAGAIVIILALLLSRMLRAIPWQTYSAYYLTGLISLAGTIVSAMLVWYGLDKQNGFLQKVCQLNDKSNCRNILDSPAAKLTGWLSWAEIGLFYFAGILLSCALGMLSGNYNLLSLLSVTFFWMTALALPYTFWSVYYQWRVAREWCILCITIQILLWINFYVTSSHFTFAPDIRKALTNPTLLKTILVSFTITPLVWALSKGHLKRSVSYVPLNKEFQKLKFDPNYLTGLFANKRTLPPVFGGMKTVDLGDTDARNKLIVVTNPTCSACRRNYKALTKELQNISDLHVIIIFAASTGTQDIGGKVATRILSLKDNEHRVSALNMWFDMYESQYHIWNKLIGVQTQDAHAQTQLIMHIRWLELAGVAQAPTQFLNSIELPKFFQSHELSRLCSFFSQSGIDQFK